MKYYDNPVFDVTIVILLFILNIKNIKAETIKCSECEFNYSLKKCKKGNDDCPSYCRPHFYKGVCYDCSVVFRNDTSQLYSIEDGKCRKKFNGQSLYITSETNEVMEKSKIIEQNGLNEQDNKLFVFGDFTYLNQPDNTDLNESSENWLLCICKTFTYIDTIFDFRLYKCVNTCPYGYNQKSVSINVCKDKCDTGYSIIVASNYSCVDKCTSEEPYYYEYEGKEYCANKCPSSKPFYYNRNENNKILCKEKCDNNNFYLPDTKECKTDLNCGTDYKLCIDFDNSIFICNKQLSGNNDCPDTFPYKYGDLCLRKCSDTQKNLYSGFSTQKTYSFISNSGKKECVTNCETGTNNEKIYHDENTLTCINNCTETSKRYFKEDKECVSSCTNFHKYGEFECISECKGTLKKSIQDKTCYEDCSKLSPIFYYNQDQKECYLKCENYIFKANENTLYCLSGCNNLPEVNNDYYHRYNDKICIESCEVNSDISPYYHIKDTTNHICYQSCKDFINSENIYEYNSNCYTELNNEFKDKLHYTVNGVTKYRSTTEDDITFCSKAGFYYIRRSGSSIECTNCGDSEYRIPYILDGNGNIKNLGECFGSNKCNATYPYYTEDKICQKVCSYKKLANKANPSDRVTSKDSNCVKECTINGYKYESSDGTTCYNECPDTEKFSYEIRAGRLKCIKDCTNISMFYNENQNGGACLDKCSTSGYSYYIPGNINNKCLSTCKNQANYKFSFQGSATDPQPCLKECPLRFQYYDDNNICLQNCNEKFISKEKKCVSSCGTGEYIINENECADDCTKNATFLDGRYNGPYKCGIKCDSGNSFYYELRKLQTGEPVYKCINNCNSESLLEFGKRCVSICPNETFQEDNKCKLKCGSKTNFKRSSISSDGIMNYICQNGCGDEYIASNGECIAKCPREENFFNSNKQCQNYCDNFYKKTNQIGTDQFGSYIIYECVDDCGNGGKVLDGTKECVTECTTDKPYLLGENTCVSICLKDQITPFSATIGNQKKCAKKCSNSGSDPKYFGDDKICIPSCRFDQKKYHNEKENDYSCVSHCDLKSENRFTYYKDNPGEYYCLTKCTQLNPSDPKKYYSTDDYVCDNTCNSRNRFLIVSQNICTNQCPDNLVANPTTNGISNYTCDYTCVQGKYYYENERICGQCKPNHYIIQGSQKCIEFCDQIISQKIYYYYEASVKSTTIKSNTCVTECPEDKPFIDYNNHCSEKCTQESHKFYSPIDKKCLDKCPEGTLTNEGKCVIKCPSGKVEDSIAKVCLDDCSTAQKNYIYFYEPERVCKKECKQGDFIYQDGKNYKCMSNCSNINEGLNKQLYIDGNKCVEKCPEYKKFFVSQKEYGEKNISKYCLTDCPIGYEFYKENVYECSGICYDYYITNRDPNVNGKECVQKCEGIYPYIYIHNNTHKECVEFCSGEKKYYDSTNTCYDICPPTSPFHEKGSFKCLKECPNEKANKKTMECVTDCEINQFWANETQNSVTTTMCYDNCNQTNYAQLSTFDKKCVKECDKENSNLQGNLDTGKCECGGLYFINDNGLKECLEPTIKLCTDTEYKIQVNGTNQCTKICFGVLSVDEDVCYWGVADTITCPQNSLLGIYKGIIKCECQYGFYKNLKNKTVCLDKTLKCPDYKYFDTQTRECVQNCGDLFLLDDKCYSYCPSGMSPDQDKKTCTCSYNFYRTEEDKYVCLGQDDLCPSDYPYLVKEKKECVKECSREYPILYDMECHSDCEQNYNKIKDPNNPDKYICVCKNIWYYDSDKSICNAAKEVKKCQDLGNGLDYTVIKTKQCVSSCKGDYQYFFNKECYYNCSESEANVVQVENSTECKCKEKWRIKTSDNNNEIECTPNCNEEENLITETNQCILKTSTCSFEKPLLWNNLCYKECPTPTIEDTVKGNTCKCQYKWFIRNDGLIECMEENTECPYDSHPYLIYQTKECVKDETYCKDKYIFNFVCYDECPINTVKPTNEDNKNCECDPDVGYWAKGKDTHGRNILECAISSCSNLNEKNKYDNDTRECVSSCDEISKNLYLDACYDPCPPLTKKVNNEYSCKLTTEFEDPDLKVLLSNVENKLLEIKDTIPSGGLVINNEENEATMQIYKIEKDEKKNKEALLRSNLAYIDISECIDKIYKANKMKGKEQVIVVKLDLKSNNKKLIVNPIEYEFRNSETGALLDASVCGRNEVVVSYPLTYLFKNKRKLRLLDDEELIEIGEKFERGKALYEKDNSIDSFNYNSTIYSNICYPIEVDGKDLTLDNRISYFYPNYSFCESTCMYDYTDFVHERIFCNCSIKTALDVDRPQGAKLAEYNKEETDNNQKGPTNLPVLKCLQYVKIKGNPGFYVCLIFFLVQLGLLFIIIFKGLSSLIINIKKKLFKEEDLNDSNVEEDFQMNVKNKEFNTGKTSERSLNNPPKKNNFVENKNIGKTKQAKGGKKPKKIVTEKNNFEVLSQANSEEYYNYLRKNEIDTNRGFFTSVRKEEKYLRENFSVSMTKDKFDVVVVVLTSIFDKIYLSKVLFLSSKYQITSLMFSLYLLCHLLLLTLCALFLDIKTISKIFENENYPNMGYYMLYGFLGNLIVWVIFKLFCCLIDNVNNIRKLFKKNSNSLKEKKFVKLNKLISNIKRDIIVYLVIQFVIIFVCSFYLIVFCGIYTGTATKLFLAYAFSLVTIVIIKIVYGLILGILRKISLFAEKNSLYNTVLIFNKYIS